MSWFCDWEVLLLDHGFNVLESQLVHPCRVEDDDRSNNTNDGGSRKDGEEVNEEEMENMAGFMYPGMGRK